MNRVVRAVDRVRRMSIGEAAFRGRTAASRALERAAATARVLEWRRLDLASRLDPGRPELAGARRAIRAHNYRAAHHELIHHFACREPRFLLHPPARDALVAGIRTAFPGAEGASAARAERLLVGVHDLLGYRGLRFAASHGSARGGAPAGLPPDGNGPTLDWHFDPVHDRRAPLTWWSQVPFLDPGVGDHKVIWELNRHQHWHDLGRAYWLTGDPRYRARFAGELRSWLRANPPLLGINWASMLELSFRCLSWIWALHFFVAGDGSIPGGQTASEGEYAWTVDLLLALDRQLRHVERNLSYYFSPNTHLTGEALGLYVAGRVLPELERSRAWEAVGRAILLREATAQIIEDGGHVERSTHYHRYTFDFYLMALAVARVTGDRPAEAAFADAVVRLARFASAMADRDGHLPLLGDDDAGSLLPLGARDNTDIVPSVAWAASLLPDRVAAPALARGASEDLAWIAGSTAEITPEPGRAALAALAPFRSGALPASGYFVMRSEDGDHLVIDAGPLGYLNAGHGHADALSLTLCAGGVPFLVDTGTGTYTVEPELRDYFRSTAAHNTLQLDGRSQSESCGPFQWRTMASARCLEWLSTDRFDYFEGVHDGYRPVLHRRAVYAAHADLWIVADHVLDPARLRHRADVHWHVDGAWRADRVAPGVVRVTHEEGDEIWLVAPLSDVRAYRAREDRRLGWRSPAYGRLTPCTTIRSTREEQAPFNLVTALVPGLGPQSAPVARRVVADYADRGISVAGISVERAGTIDLVLSAVPAGRGRQQSGWFLAGGVRTDARFLHIKRSAQGLASLVLVDGTFVEDGETGWRIDGEARFPSLHVELAGGRSVARVLVEGAPAPFSTRGSSARIGRVETPRLETTGAEAAMSGPE